VNQQSALFTRFAQTHVSQTLLWPACRAAGEPDSTGARPRPHLDEQVQSTHKPAVCGQHTLTQLLGGQQRLRLCKLRRKPISRPPVRLRRSRQAGVLPHSSSDSHKSRGEAPHWTGARGAPQFRTGSSTGTTQKAGRQRLRTATPFRLFELCERRTQSTQVCATYQRGARSRAWHVGPLCRRFRTPGWRSRWPRWPARQPLVHALSAA